MPTLILLAGPNGAGKSTAAPGLLRGELAPITFLNADTVAQGLSSYRPEEVSVQAGRIVLQRIKELSDDGESFAVETTLAGRGYVRLVKHLKSQGYGFQLIFLWLPTPMLALGVEWIRFSGVLRCVISVNSKGRSNGKEAYLHTGI